MMNRNMVRLRNRSYDRLRDKPFMERGGRMPSHGNRLQQPPVEAPMPSMDGAKAAFNKVRKDAINGILNENIILKKENHLIKTEMKKQQLIISGRKKPQDFTKKRTPRQMGGVINPRQIEAQKKVRRGGFITMKNK
jgi:hypothetical protein